MFESVESIESVYVLPLYIGVTWGNLGLISPYSPQNQQVTYPPSHWGNSWGNMGELRYQHWWRSGAQMSHINCANRTSRMLGQIPNPI